jgi:putative membrane protein
MSDKVRRLTSLCAMAFAMHLLAVGAQAQEPDTDRRAMPSPNRTALKSVTPEEFAKQAAVIGKAEIELGQLAMQRTTDTDVRRFAQKMVKDHAAADAKLKKIAAQENLTLPQSLDAEHQAVKQKLSGLSGDAFDAEYKKVMAKGHDKAVALFQSAAQTPQMPDDLKEFAASTLPTLEQHKDMAHSLHADQGA